MEQGRVSAVIPTRGRPGMVGGAVRSALAQGDLLAEVIVVVDGPDPETVAALMEFASEQAEERVRVIELREPVGGGEARNLGVRAACAEWVGFLDDDDEWLPGKLTEQMAAGEREEASGARQVVLASAVLARSPAGDQVWPRRILRAGEPMGEYLFCRHGWAFGEALLQSSTLLARRELWLRVAWTPGLKKHQDWDWLLRVTAEADVRVVQLAKPLVIFRVEDGRKSVGRLPDWEFSWRWAADARGRMGKRAYAAFLATECASQMARAGAGWGPRLRLLGAMAAGAGWRQWLLALVFVMVPVGWRRGLRERLRAWGSGHMDALERI